MSEEPTETELEELMVETADRLLDLSMALTDYRPAIAMGALASALGALLGIHPDAGPALPDLIGLVEEQAKAAAAEHARHCQEEAN